MESEKKKIITELIMDIIYVGAIILATIYATTKLFPTLRGVNVQNPHEYICSDLSKCKCDDDYCICSYCTDNTCNEIKEEKCSTK